MKRKRSVSIIESIIALGMVALLTSTLCFWYRSVSRQKELFHTLKAPLSEERYAYQRLQPLLSTARTPFFSAGTDGVAFVFEREAATEPLLSGKVIARLYFDQASGCLSLGIWPYPTKGEPLYSPSRTFVILDRVEKCEFQFYSPPSPHKQIVDPEVVGKLRPIEGWQENWDPAFKTLPAMIKLTLTRSANQALQERTLDYFFDLPVIVSYPKESA